MNTNLIISRLLDTNGNQTGATAATGDYSSAAEDFYIQPESNLEIIVTRMVVCIVDAGAFDSGAYGNNITLTNGIDVIYSRGGQELSLMGGVKVKTNVEWGRWCYDVSHHSFGLGNEFLLIRWTFEKSGTPLLLRGEKGDKFIVRLNDDFTDLVDHTFAVQGHFKSVWAD